MGHCVWWLLEYFWCKCCMQTAWIRTNRYIGTYCMHTMVRQNCDCIVSCAYWWCCQASNKLQKNSVYVLLHSVKFSSQVQLLGLVPTSARELEPFFWTNWGVLGMRRDLWTVPATHLAFTTVPTMKMLESPVKVCMHACVPWLVYPQYNYCVSLKLWLPV